jgi:hypothetical protein
MNGRGLCSFSRAFALLRCLITSLQAKRRFALGVDVVALHAHFASLRGLPPL